MLQRLREIPLLVILMGIAALAMYIPAAHAIVSNHHRVAQAFFYSGTLFLILAAMIAIATANWHPRNPARSQLWSLAGAYLVLPLVLAVPFVEAVRDTSYLNAWFEMVSSFTTTGATLYDTAGRLPPSVHLWRGLVGWLGGLFVLVAAAAILAPMNLGGFELLSPRAIGRTLRSPGQTGPRSDPSTRLIHHVAVITPVYAGLTLAIWVGLRIAGDPGLVALMHAMAVLSTSGISPVQGLSGSGSGLAGEILLFLGMALALTRRSLPAPARIDRTVPVWRDPEVRLAAILITAVPAALFLRHWVGAIESDLPATAAVAWAALWGSVFTVTSFLTTTGFEAAGWTEARIWSGLDAPGLILLGLAIMGGGVATTAGGVKLLRVHALYGLGQRELERLSLPSSVGGGGQHARNMRREGAYIAFVFFMLFALSLGLANLALALAGLGFERAMVLSVAALTTTGPLAAAALGPAQAFAGLGDAAKAILAACMVLGRLETLALLALVAPAGWRR